MRVADCRRLELGVFVLGEPLAHSHRELVEILKNVLRAWASELQVKEANFLARSDQLRHLNRVSVQKVGKGDGPQSSQRLPLGAHIKR